MALDISMLPPSTMLQLLYIGYYGRAADPSGFDFWMAFLREREENEATQGIGFGEIANDFFSQIETRVAYNLPRDQTASDQLLPAEGFLQKVYKNLFERDPDAQGLAFWTGVINSGTMPMGDVILEIIKGAQGEDITTIFHKAGFAQAWTDAATQAGVGDFDPNQMVADANYKSSRAAVDGVGSDPKSFDKPLLQIAEDFDKYSISVSFPDGSFVDYISEPLPDFLLEDASLINSGRIADLPSEADLHVVAKLMSNHVVNSLDGNANQALYIDVPETVELSNQVGLLTSSNNDYLL